MPRRLISENPIRFLYSAISAIALASVLGCQAGSLPLSLPTPKLTLQAGEAAQLQLGMRPGYYHAIEVEAEVVGEGGAELVVSSGSVEVPPIYFDATSGSQNRFDARIWSPTWPMAAEAPMRVANYGPGSVTLERVKARTGGSDEIYAEVMSRGPRPVSWTDIKIKQEQGVLEGKPSAFPPEEIEGVRAWVNQRRRRLAFEAISGPPIPVRMAEPIRGNVQVRAAAIGGAGAIVGLSRPNPVIWKSLGPGWYPRTPWPNGGPFPGTRECPGVFNSMAAR